MPVCGVFWFVCLFVFLFVFFVNLQSGFEQVLTAADGITKNPKKRDSPCSDLFILI